MKRETISYERVLYYIGNVSPMYFAFCVKVKGDIPRAGLKEALAELQRRHPLARARVEMTADKKQYVTDANVGPIPVKEFDGGGTDWQSLLKQELLTPFDIFSGPMIRLNLIRNEDSTDIVAVFHHALCDGLSAVQFLHEMLVFLSGAGAGLRPYAEAPVFTRLIKKEIMDVIDGRELPPWLKNKEYLKIELKPPKEEPFPRPDFALHHWFLDREQTGKLVARAKEWGISVHALMGAVVLKVFAGEFGENQGYTRKLQSPLSFKPFLRDEAREYFGLFNGLLSEEFDCSPGRSVREIAGDIYRRLRDKIANHIPLDGYYFFNTYFLDGIEDPELYYANRPAPVMDYDVSLSNLGRVTMQETYGDYAVEKLFGPVFSAIRGERVIGVNTFGGRMFFTCIYDKDCFDHSTGSRIIARVQDMFREQQF
jgi:NRPS condensation-like uncharacterized protein